ncbi:MAG TPA: zinc ABC transporter substrate-binding protein [Candidatus Competibacteraceae bacterium]|nr:zinc ABC transporter substrate-binding protein [Gammaproteobacteria bacterium]HPF57611.1 zinc ABC transporter substrate-binding protein [Candidatus Competibacteraceae bacterium]HRY17005.1 zinc ABC transporter substrate-binding protein [Candidatus Competibacteraceae bacterium]
MQSHSLLLKGLQNWLKILLLLLPLAGFTAGLPVMVSIKPVHSLVASVMQGVDEPFLLVKGGASPHDYRLRPSDARAMEQARVAFWIGPGMENFLTKPLENVQGKIRAVALLETPGIKVLPLRTGGAWEGHRHDYESSSDDHDHDHDHDHGHEASHDLHIWLDPVNAIAMTREIVSALSEIDPEHQADYQRNGAALIERLGRLNQQLESDLAHVKEQPYVVFHDAYQYFEQRYGLNAVGSVVLDPEQRPGAQRVAEIQARIRDLKVRCVFSEPQFQSALAVTIVSGSGAQQGILDPLGAELPEGPDAYFQLLQGLADALKMCLSKT